MSMEVKKKEMVKDMEKVTVSKKASIDIFDNLE
jgi:hypothetical protein